MKKITLFLVSVIALTTQCFAQSAIVNFDFNTTASYPVSASSTTAGISCSATSTETVQVYTGTATGSLAFTNNTTAGNPLTMANSGGTNTRNFIFQLSGSDLANYQAYKLYFQPQCSSTGATLITLAYSINGSSYTNFSTT